MQRWSDFMMSRLKVVLSHLLFKLYHPVVRWSTCLRNASLLPAHETRTKHSAPTWDRQLCVPRDLDLMGTFCPSLALSASSRLCATQRWFTPGAWCPMSGLSGFRVVDLLQAVIRECWAHAGRPSRPGTETRPPSSPPPSAPAVIN